MAASVVFATRCLSDCCVVRPAPCTTSPVLDSLVETVELVVSELATNAIKASVGIDGIMPSYTQQERLKCIGLFLASDRQRVLVDVWDSNPRPPVRAEADEQSESSRGLLLVDALCEKWDWHRPKDGHEGKWVWGVVGLSSSTRRRPW